MKTFAISFIAALTGSDFLKLIFSADISIVNIPIPVFKIVLIVIVLTLTVAFKQVFSEIIIRRIERLTSKTETTIDDELVEIIKQPLNWLIVIGGLWIVQLILAENFNPELNKQVEGILRFTAYATFAFIVYRAAPVLGEVLKQWTLSTETELDDLLVPYLPKLFQVLAIAIILLKGSEVFLGASAGALIGLLGGAGVAIGLLLKDLIYDLCCTIIIYVDNLFRPGDQVTMPGVEGLIKVENVGLRSTTLRILTRNTIQKVPNSKMINGTVENQFQAIGNDNSIGINLTLKIDGISAEKTEKLCIGLREIPKSIDILTEKFFIYFSELNQNSRVIKIRVFANTNGNPQLYFNTIEKLNLAILTLLEKEQINQFSYYPVQLQTNLGEAQNNLEPIKN
ncbi:MscS mechanosensitive ion channel [Tolypothrix sp. NIES-4075]|uniref:mechanosensitive ion channel family protein n=1 Tax=Tolypothrix sp. NIES-4075 TaxID=2005459 RepID=UPI000B5C8C8C|nr:mechanosensitive ion channel domain-containing protein [Tolypothrix sp. NIES-4075]GAX40830.1 MscS mechanosensitive ion channel [Tolypothrix sp. NIES-4075]